MARRLLIEEEIEGDCEGMSDIVFCRIGEPVRLMPTTSSSAFGLSDPPLQPLAVSERHRLLFLAHSEGFLVANTKDVIVLAKDAQKGKDHCIQKSCVVNVQIGRVSILSLSGDSSMLAATVGGNIHLFHVKSLLDKVKEPVISSPLNKSGIVKDLKWRRNSDNSFIVLSSHGSLCHGSSSLQLKDVIDNVDAVDWSVDGNFVAIARKDIVSILTSSFEEILGIPLLFQSWIVDSGSKIKVDSIKWVRQDSIVIGCTQLKEDCEDDRYLVQVIASGEHNFTEVSCKPLIFSFPDLFEGLSVDMLPPGVGPYLLLDYLDCWDVAFTSNKRNVDQHISFLRWIVEDNMYEVVSLELGSDKYIPRIDLQDDGDDNLVLGLAVDKVSLYEKITIQHDLEFKELSPRCVLLCLTCDGKLTLYHAAWLSDTSDFPEAASSYGDNIVNAGLVISLSAESDLGVTTSILKDEQHAAISSNIHSSAARPKIGAGGKIGSCGTLDGEEQCSYPGSGMKSSTFSEGTYNKEPNMFSESRDLGTNFTIYEMNNESMAVKGSGTCKTFGSNFTARPSFEPQIVQKPFGINDSNANSSSATKETMTSKSLGPTFNQLHPSRSQTSKPFGKDDSKEKFFLSSPGKSNLSGIVNESIYSPPSSSPADLPTFSQPFGTLASSEIISESGLPDSNKSGYSGSSTIFKSSLVAATTRLPGSIQQLPHPNSTSSKPRHTLESEPQFSKNFYNVKDLTKELDSLLSCIECEGGFKDLCSVIQEQSLLELEGGLDDLSEMLFVNKNIVENQVVEIQLLRKKMLEVSARQVYMKCIVQQASDNRYWDIWNTQKLSPEFEAKRRLISNLKQNLTNQLVELERHFNGLEINKFGEYNAIPSGRRGLCGNSSSLRPTRSLHSLYRTVNSQLATAEKLSEFLSKQMALLNITSSISEKPKFTKELFESIGLDPKIDVFLSPDLNSTKLVPYSSNRSSLSKSTASKGFSWKHAPTSSKVFESSRRKMDSLDKGWTHFQPSRSTVRRTSKNENVRSNLDVTFREAKEVYDSQVKAFDIAQSSMSNFSRASSEPFGVNKRTSTEATSFMSKTTSSHPQSLHYSPNKGSQEKSSKKALDAQFKSVFKWAKDPAGLTSEPNAISSSHSSKVFQNATTQPASLTAPTMFSNSNSNKDEKSGLTYMFNMTTPSAQNQSSIAVTKTSLVSKPASVSTQQKFTDSVSSVNTASAAGKRSQLYQETSLKSEVDILDNLIHASTKNSAVSSSIFSTSIAQSSASLPSSTLQSFQFGQSMVHSNSLSPSKSDTPCSFSNELALKSKPFLESVHASEDERSPNEIGLELGHATSQSTNNADSVKQLSSELKTDSSQTSVCDLFSPKKEFGFSSASINAGTDDNNTSKVQQITLQTPSTSTSILPSITNESVFPKDSDVRAKAEFVGTLSSSIMTTVKDEHLDGNLSQEDEMEEEALDANSVLNLESLGGFSLQSTPSSNDVKPNPFGSLFAPPSTGSTSPLLSWNTSPGQLFRPPSFNLPESQPSQDASSSLLTGVVSGGFSGFGQPAQLGAGQQALGSVLGSFGQSRQLGIGMQGYGFASSGIPAAGSSGGSTNIGGFAGVAKVGGFAGLAPNTGGFAGAATFSGGFAGAASTGGGFAGVASAGGGFGGANSSSGFSSGGFGGFSNIQGGGFSGFGAGKSGAGRPPAELLTQMRK